MRVSMRRVFFAVALILLGTGAGAGQMRRSGLPTLPSAQEVSVSADRLDRLQRWLKVVDRHEPGVQDDAAAEVGAWTNTDLRGLWVDVNVLAQLMRNLRLSRFIVRGEGQARPTEIRYTSQQLRQLR